jgi:hypothetical protein
VRLADVQELVVNVQAGRRPGRLCRGRRGVDHSALDYGLSVLARSIWHVISPVKAAITWPKVFSRTLSPVRALKSEHRLIIFVASKYRFANGLISMQTDWT